jgi:hypothetical protein
MGANAFVAARVVLDVSFDAARCRLGRLARDGVLLGASEYAYGVGATGLAEAAGRAAGMSRLAGVRPGDLAETPDQAWLWLRWDAIASDGTLFPALDARLALPPPRRVSPCSPWRGSAGCLIRWERGWIRPLRTASPP